MPDTAEGLSDSREGQQIDTAGSDLDDGIGSMITIESQANLSSVDTPPSPQVIGKGRVLQV